jgi:hypothetical protein
MSTGLATNTGFYVKPKQQAEFKNKWVGPIQMCNLGFRCSEENITNVQAVLKDTGFSFKILPGADSGEIGKNMIFFA